MHGGADGSGAPKGERNGNYKHGRYTKEVAATRRITDSSRTSRHVRFVPDITIQATNSLTIKAAGNFEAAATVKSGPEKAMISI